MDLCGCVEGKPTTKLHCQIMLDLCSVNPRYLCASGWSIFIGFLKVFSSEIDFIEDGVAQSSTTLSKMSALLRKYNRGHFRPTWQRKKGWVFGMLEVKGARRLPVLKMVRDRSRNTLMPLIRKHIRRGSTVYSDCWRAYQPALNVEGYRHLSVNHREHFVDPLTGCHTQHIERAGKPSSATFHVTEATRHPNFLNITLDSFSGIIGWVGDIAKFYLHS